MNILTNNKKKLKILLMTFLGKDKSQKNEKLQSSQIQ